MKKIIAIEAQRLFRPKKHGMEIVALEILKQLKNAAGNDFISVSYTHLTLPTNSLV